MPSLAELTGNNTSAPSTFKTMSNGNLGACNVSKINYRRLCPNFKGKIKAHVMPWWWPNSNHTSGPGYDMRDPAVAKAMVSDMIERGCDGIVIAEGFTNNDSKAAQLSLFKECASRSPKFEFAAMLTQWVLTSTSNVNTLLDYIYTTFLVSPCYCRFNNRPVIYIFNSGVPVDFVACKNYALNKYSIAPIFIFRHKTGYAKVGSEGAFSWIGDDSTPAATTSYMTDFYANVQPTKFSAGSVYKGFNDSLAAWTPSGGARIINQQGGKTWLDSWALLDSKAPNLQEVEIETWNDYEEGTEVETGIDGGVICSASLSGTTLIYAASPSERVEKVEVYASTDVGQNFSQIAQNTTILNSSLDLTTSLVSPGTYTILVRAVGKPGFANAVAAPLTLTIAPPPPPPPTPDVVVNTAYNVKKLLTLTLSLSDGSAITAVSATWQNGTPVEGLNQTNISSKVMVASILAPIGMTSMTIKVYGAQQIGEDITINL